MKLIDEMSYIQRERLIFIDLCLSYLGEISRVDLIDKFKIGPAAATRDFAIYRELVPANMDLRHTTKTYHIADTFKPLFEHEAESILHKLSCDLGMPYPNQLHQTCINSLSLVNPSSQTISTVMRAIAKHKALACEYVSLNSGTKKRVIIPHSIVNNGKRWHVRAYDGSSETFKDFVITRFKQLDIIDKEITVAQKRDSDNQWNRIVDLVLIPHPNARFPEGIELDYAMVNGELRLPIRAALAGYMLNQWNVDCSETHFLNCKQYQLALKAREAIYGVENAYLAPGYQEIKK
ncbi:WYL domain-containing protein [Psychromonas sp. CNPT3]|uniref:WYL domain-containing protein n=1 Tax=Psychromonas sp. CNPT3 TaxID=314282 RepID=UPI0005A0AC26|nr:WYL domain-containing protein [Psychromonas sp. CNPT3]